MFKRNAKGAMNGEKLRLRKATRLMPGRSLDRKYQPSPLRGFQRVHIRTEVCGFGQASAGRFA